LSQQHYIYIGQYEGISLSSFFIKRFTWSDVTHTSAFKLKAGRVIEAWRGGVVERNWFEGHERGTKITIYRVPCTQSQKFGFYQYLDECIGKKYDFLGILGFTLRAKIEDKDKVVCSELVFAAAKHVGINLLERIEAYKVTPGLINVSPLLEFVETRFV
jgi:uncharacterized protein YycO